jgi:hypothetical protein
MRSINKNPMHTALYSIQRHSPRIPRRLKIKQINTTPKPQLQTAPQRQTNRILTDGFTEKTHKETSNGNATFRLEEKESQADEQAKTKTRFTVQRPTKEAQSTHVWEAEFSGIQTTSYPRLLAQSLASQR